MATKSLAVDTDRKTQVIDITDAVAESIPPEVSGTATVFSQHTTATITINEAESRLLGDFESALEDIVPSTGWAHDEIDNNADSHVRSLLLGPSETIPVDNGELQLGTWQSILFVELDGPRSRSIQVSLPG